MFALSQKKIVYSDNLFIGEQTTNIDLKYSELVDLSRLQFIEEFEIVKIFTLMVDLIKLTCLGGYSPNLNWPNPNIL